MALNYPVNFWDLLCPDVRKVYRVYDNDMAIVRTPPKWVLVGPVTAIHHSVKALCIRIANGNGFKDYWIPKGQINHDETEVSKIGDKGIIVITEWIAKEKGLI